MSDWYRWLACPDCGGRMLSVGGVVGHWFMTQERNCFARQAIGRGSDRPWQAR